MATRRGYHRDAHIALVCICACKEAHSSVILTDWMTKPEKEALAHDKPTSGGKSTKEPKGDNTKNAIASSHSERASLTSPYPTQAVYPLYPVRKMAERGGCLMSEIDNLINDVEEEGGENYDELQFCVAPVTVPRNFIKDTKTKCSNNKLFDFHKGTTTLAFKFKEGIIVAVDSRASMGSFISSQNVEKIIEINKNILGTMAGGAADCLYWEKYLGKIIKIYELRNNEKISVRAASTILSNILYQYKGYGLCCGIILSGYDHTGFNMFYIDDEGKKVEGNLFSCGSGSTYAYSILDSAYDYNLSLEQAVELARNAIYHATFRDGGSGGKVRVFYIHKNGYDKIIEGQDVYELHYHYTNPAQNDQHVM